MDETSRRGFLAKLGGLATAPVLTAFVDTGSLAVPDRRVVVDPGEPPPPLVISSLLAPGPGFRAGDVMRAPDGLLVVWVDGQPWQIAAHRL